MRVHRVEKNCCSSQKAMLVKDIDTLAKRIAEYFNNNYTASTSITVPPGLGGWKVADVEEEEDTGTRRFSDDFLSVSLPRVLKACVDDRLADGEMYSFLPDDIYTFTADLY